MGARIFALIIATAAESIGFVQAQDSTDPFRRLDARLTDICLMQHLIEVHNRYHSSDQAAGLSDIAWLIGGIKAKRCGGDPNALVLSAKDRAEAERIFQESRNRTNLVPAERAAAERIFQKYVEQLDTDLGRKLPK